MRRIGKQARGAGRNLRETAGSFKPTRIMPRAVRRLFGDARGDVNEHSRGLLGLGTRKQQIYSALFLGGVFIATSILSAGATLALIGIIVVPILVFALLRHIPVVERTWTRGRDRTLRGGSNVRRTIRRGGRR